MLSTLYFVSLDGAAQAVRNGDKTAAMFCLSQAIREANRAGNSEAKRRVFRAMSFARRIP